MQDTLRRADSTHISVVVPVLNEGERINSFIAELNTQRFDGSCEIIVVDGDPRGGTINLIEDCNIVRIAASRGRGRQMNAGAAVARGRILLFLHADTRLPADAFKKICDLLENREYVGGAFDLRIDSDRLMLRYISARANFRSRLNRIPYGDQAIFIRKSYFDEIGGFKDIPLMEDVDLMRRIKKDGRKIHILADKVVTSSRRWERQGAVYTTLKNQLIVILYYLGVSPHKLAEFYGYNGYVGTAERDSSFAGKAQRG